MRNGSLICVNAARHPPRATSPDDALARGKKVGMSRFTSHIVLPDQVRTVYPLVREAVPGLELRTWVASARMLTNPRSAPRDLVQPGHVFPLKSRAGGVLERAGQTEAAVDLARLAGLNPAGVI